MEEGLSRRGDVLTVGSMSRRSKAMVTSRTAKVKTADADEDEEIP